MLYTLLGSGYPVVKVTDRGEKAGVCVHVHRKRQTLSYLMRPEHSGWQFAAGLNVNLNQNPHGNAEKTV